MGLTASGTGAPWDVPSRGVTVFCLVSQRLPPVLRVEDVR